MRSLVCVGYFASWSIYHKKHNIWDVDVANLTHLNYAFAKIENGQVKLTDPWADTDQRYLDREDSWNDPNDYLFGSLGQLFKLKTMHRTLKTGLSIGGWTHSDQFSQACATRESREILAQSMIRALIDYGLDYIDLDWEYPVEGGMDYNHRSPQDALNLVELLKMLNCHFKRLENEFGRRHFVTIAAPAMPSIAKHILDQRIWEHLEFINLMTYDFSGSWSPVFHHHSNLMPGGRGELSVKKSIEFYLSNGVPSEKLVVGVPFYGRLFRSLGDVSLGCKVAPVTENEGIIGFNSIDDSFEKIWDEKARAAFGFQRGSNLIVSYDDHRSISEKIQFVRQTSLGGLMFWESSGDYPAGDPRSLLAHISSQIKDSRESSLNSISYPDSRFVNLK